MLSQAERADGTHARLGGPGLFRGNRRLSACGALPLARDRHSAMRLDQRLSGMRGDIPGSAWPPLFSGRTASLAAAIQQFELTQWLPPAEIEAGQRRQLGQLASYYAQHSEAFRVRLASAGLT